MSRKMSPRFEVNVHKCHVERAKECNAHECMIVQAIRDAHPRFRRIRVDTQSIRITDPETNKRYTYLTPLVAQQNIVAFDERKPVSFFKFKLERAVKVASVKRQGGKTTSGPKPQHKRTPSELISPQTRVRGLCLNA